MNSLPSGNIGDITLLYLYAHTCMFHVKD